MSCLGIRYFMIKSWTSDNVQDAQREGIWATQTIHTEVFKEAFQNSLHVILVFSVNGSKCFQGYVRLSLHSTQHFLTGAAIAQPWYATNLSRSSGPVNIDLFFCPPTNIISDFRA